MLQIKHTLWVCVLKVKKDNNPKNREISKKQDGVKFELIYELVLGNRKDILHPIDKLAFLQRHCRSNTTQPLFVVNLVIVSTFLDTVEYLIGGVFFLQLQDKKHKKKFLQK